MFATRGPNPVVDAALADGLTALVSQAARAILAVGRGDLAVRHKADQSPVTAADEAANAVLLAGLAQLLPDMPVVSEESVGQAPEPGATYVVVDPLDGTKEFVAGLDEFVVNLALIRNRSPVAGFVAVPTAGLVYRGIVGSGAECLRLAPGDGPADATARMPIRTRSRPPADLVAVVSRSHLDPDTRGFLERLPIGERVACGSALKFCWIAEGKADVYPRLAPTCEWDIAAGHALVVSAGGSVLRPDGTPLFYGDRADAFRVPGFVAWGTPSQPGHRGIGQGAEGAWPR